MSNGERECESEEWRTNKKRHKRKNTLKEVNAIHCSNYCELLSDEDEVIEEEPEALEHNTQ